MGKITNISDFFFLVKTIWTHGKFYCISTILISLIITPINNIASVLFTQKVINSIVIGKSFNEILFVVLGFVAILLSTNIIQSVFTNKYKNPKWTEISQKINQSIYNQVKQTDYEYFDDPEYYNDYTWTITEYSERTNEANVLIQSICRSISTIISMATIIAVLGPGLIALTVLVMCIFVAIDLKRNRIVLKRQEQLLPIDRKIEYVKKIYYNRDYAADIRSTRLKEYLDKSYESNCNEKIDVIKKNASIILRWILAQNIISVIYNASIIIYITYSFIVSNRISSIGVFTGLLTANSQLMNSLYELFGFVTKANNLGLYAARIKRFFAIESRIESEDNKKDKENIINSPFSIEFKSVSFKYRNSDFGIQDINFFAMPGETIAIVGTNGAGKTTLVKLLLGLYRVDEGDILINNRCIYDYNIEQLRKKSGVIFQKTNIYAFSVYDNINLYANIPIEHAQQSITELNLNSSLAKSNGTIFSPMTKEFDSSGVVLSGGESQKLALARVMNANFGVLLLDEPSSALDPIAEHEMIKLLFEKTRNTTKIIIAHRLSTIRHANRIYVLDNGKIKETGTHDELMKKEGLYYKMFIRQAEGYIE